MPNPTETRYAVTGDAPRRGRTILDAIAAEAAERDKPAEPAVTVVESRPGVDPDLYQWRDRAREMCADLTRHLTAIFEWIDSQLVADESPGIVALFLAESDLYEGRPLSHVVADLFLLADLDMPCPHPGEVTCRCGFCEWGRQPRSPRVPR